jgi:hypothetical protein
MQYQNDRAIKLAQYLGNKTGRMCKKAGGLMDSYSGLDPRLQAGLLGAGGGALVGGLGNALFGDDRQGFLSRLLSGAVGGGTVGGLSGAGAQHFGADLAGTGNEYFKRMFGPKAPVSPYAGSFMNAMQNKVNSGGEIGLGAGTTKDQDGSIVNDLVPKPITNQISRIGDKPAKPSFTGSDLTDPEDENVDRETGGAANDPKLVDYKKKKTSEQNAENNRVDAVSGNKAKPKAPNKVKPYE